MVSFYMRKQKVKQLASMKRESNSVVPDDVLDKWLVKGLLEDLKDQERASQYEFNDLWKFCEGKIWLFEPCPKEIVEKISEKEKESNC